MTHDFTQCLDRSHAASDLQIWGECYRQAFPNMVAMVDHRQNGDHQKAGIDRSVILSNGRPIWIDEKVRSKDYGDVALEEWSSEEHRRPGWVVKPLLCDYIAYAVLPAGKCFLLPVEQLQQAWKKHGAEWKRTYNRKVPAKNFGYTTISWGVPADVLFKAIGGCLRVTFTPIAEGPK